MPQQTNLNVAPYFDDFDASNDYHKVLFKPGYPVQARELTTLQSILQNQIEKFGKHFFKEGAKVIPGNTGYTQLYYGIQLNNSFKGVQVAAYADQLLGAKITGQTSGVSAVVDKVLFPEESERGQLTLYVSYLNSSTTNNSTQVFADNEELVCNTTITSGLLGNTSIPAGAPFGATISNNAAVTGSSFQIQEGVYFFHGQFVAVQSETLILDQYTNRSNYRVGLFVQEEIVNSDMDESLNDNSQGFNNYAAPGADRLKITCRLFKKALNDFVDDTSGSTPNTVGQYTDATSVTNITNVSVNAPSPGGGYFVELAQVKEGNLKTVRKAADDYSSNFLEILARRTYAESGDYYVKPFDLNVLNSLNNNIGNRGIYQEGQFTQGGSTPTDNLSLYKLSPGKAFVRGWEIETTNASFLDAEKPRTVKTIEDQTIIYNTGPTLKLNRNYRSPTIGIGNTYVVSLRNERVGYSSESLPGKEIGVARIYDYTLESGSYNTTNDKLNEWDISLYDVQTITEIAVNESITLSVPTFIKGVRSGATAFLKDSVSAGTALTVYETEGDFILNESLNIDGVANGRIAIAITASSIGDVKSLYGTNNGVVGLNTFSADVIQSTSFNVGIATISPFAGATGISTVKSPNELFPGNLFKENNLVQFSDPTVPNIPTIARVVSVGSSHITIAGIATVSDIVNGKLPSASLDVTDFKLLTTNLQPNSDNALYTKLPKDNISNVNLTDASITIRKTESVNISGNQLSDFVYAGTDETFIPFDEERYSLIRSDGTTEVLTTDKVIISAGGTRLQILNLGSNDTAATLVTTLKKLKPKAKVKIKNRVNSLTVSKSINPQSGIGTTNANDGLDYGAGTFPYGTRVQDEHLSLNTPDIIKIHAVFESADTSAPSAPKALLTSIKSASSTTAELIVGEYVVGQTSGAYAIVAEKLSNLQISFIYKNDNRFKEGETIIAQESNVEGTIVTLDSPSFNITNSYKWNAGQENTFYDYGTLIRKSTAENPSRQLKVYFANGYYESTDDGNITTIESYDTYDYATELGSVDGNSVSDIIDIRPRVSDYTVAAGTRSPLEFYGRTFNGAGQTGSFLASDGDIKTSFSFYLGRVDRIFLTKDGDFVIKYGTPSEKPERPGPVDDALEVAKVTLPPYLYDVSDAEIEFLDHKRFRMVDIKGLESRIKNLEYYTALSLAEINTANMFIPDEDGLNRYKSGFFVDNFTGFLAQEDRTQINNSIDRKRKEVRPRHYTNAVDLGLGPVTNLDSTSDLNFLDDPNNINITKQNDIVTLRYDEVVWLEQNFATRSESVTPFLISFWQGTMDLTPASDTWVDTVRLEAKIIQQEGNYAETLAAAGRQGLVDPQTGFGPMIWDSWQTNWTGTDVIETTRTRNERIGWRGQGPGGRAQAYIGDLTDRTIEETLRERVDTGRRSRRGSRTTIVEQFDQHSVGDRVISRDLVPFMRARNIEFVTKRMKPLTKMYGFFDGVDVTKYCVPKLLEINMTSGTFEVGETVIGTVQEVGLGNDQYGNAQLTTPGITFRVAQSNHKEGPYNIPTSIYTESPYNNTVLQESYSSTSTILNVDTYSLANESQGAYYGWVENGMKLVGKSSGAQASITNVRLISDLGACLIGSLYLPNPNGINHPRFETGTKVFTLVNDEDNDQDLATTIAEESYSAAGTLETVQENIISVRNARVEQKQEFKERAITRTTGMQVVNSRVVSERTRHNVVVGWYDPLAQSFLVDEDEGVFVTSCDVFFRSKDDMDIPLVFQLRTMKGGFPTQHVVPFSEIVLDPIDIVTSGDGSQATTVEFKAPVYLEGGLEYAICLASNSTKYSVYISRIGENDLLTQTFISNQPYLGSLFKSQNASTWEASQWEDLKFTLYRADFDESGTVEFYSPELTKGNNQIPVLMPDSLNIISREVRVGLGTTIADIGYEFGNVVSQLTTNATGTLIGVAGSASGTLNITNAGIGYTPADGSRTVSGVNLVTVTGNGRGATGDISIKDGVAIAATIIGGGSGYQVGDVVGFTTLGVNSVGRDCRLSIVSIGMTSELILNNVQDNFVVGAAKTIQYTNSAGNTVNLNASWGGNVQVSSLTNVSDGLHIKVDHQNHGMYFTDNLVAISDVQSDIKPTKLSVALDVGAVDAVSVDSASNFGTFENVGVGTTNYGYLQIGEEIISYESVSGNLIGISTRGSNPTSYPDGTPVYKYELGGVSLNRINKTHDLNDPSVSNPITFDSYYVKLDMSQDGTERTSGGYPKLYLNSTKSTGGNRIRSTQNMPFEVITPSVQNLSIRGTSVTGEIRTITSSSMSGNEIPFVDNGYESITLNKTNYFDSPRMIASKINEDLKLDNIPGNKSLNMRLYLNTTNTKLSPVIDAQRVSTILTSNRVNSVITDYATDSRVKTIANDPTACQYISKEIILENSATAIKIFVDAYINVNCDIRAFYAISNKEGSDPVFVPFPGYSNLNSKGEIIALKDSNGQSDVFIPKSNTYGFDGGDLDFVEHVFTADPLPSFRRYRVKVILTSTNQVYVPRMKDLRVMALA